MALEDRAVNQDWVVLDYGLAVAHQYCPDAVDLEVRCKGREHFPVTVRKFEISSGFRRGRYTGIGILRDLLL